MVKASPLAPVCVADAATSSRDMHHEAVQQVLAHDSKFQLTKTPSLISGPIAAAEITRKDVHTASSINAQRLQLANATKEPKSDREGALRQVQGKDCNTGASPDQQAAARSKPVLVRALSAKADMRKKQEPGVNSESPKFPAVEAFSFQDILASLGPEAYASIDTIAEILSRSKISLAEEHGSHLPPQGPLLTSEIGSANPVLPTRLEPVAESSSRPQTRSMSRSLALATSSTQNKNGSQGNPTAATSTVTSHTHLPGQKKAASGATSAQPSLVPQVLAWLRSYTSIVSQDNANFSDRDARAANALHRLLGDTASPPS